MGIAAALLGSALAGFLGTRAALLSFTHDESLNYNCHVAPGLFGILDFSVVTNHFLNSVLMAISSAVLGPGEFALRLPNVLGGIAYLAAGFLLLRRFQDTFIRTAGLALLILNPFVLDFQALARGYGLGCTFVLWSLYFFTRAAPDAPAHRQDVPRALWCAWLSVLCNLSFLVFYLALVATHLLVDARWFLGSDPARSTPPSQDTGRLRPWLRTHQSLGNHLVLLLISVGAMVWEPASVGGLYYGGMTGFWADTVRSLIDATLYGFSYSPGVGRALELAVALVAMAGAGAAIIAVIRRDAHGFLTMTTFMVLVAMALCTIAQHAILGTPFLQDRTALFFIPVFVLLFLSLVAPDGATPAGPVRILLARILLAVVLTTAVVHADRVLTLDRAHGWRQDVDTRDMMRDLAADPVAAGTANAPCRLGVSWIHEPVVNYYRLTWHLDWLRPVTRDPMDGRYDYFYFTREDAPTLERLPMSVLCEYPRTGNTLAKRAGHPVGK